MRHLLLPPSLLILLLAARPSAAETPAAAPAASAPAGDRAVDIPAAGRRLHLLFTTDVFGRYAWPACRGTPPTDRAELPQLIGAVSKIKQELRAAGERAPLVLHAGSMIRFDLLGEHVFGSDDTAREAAALIDQVGFDALSVGIHDFGAAPAALRRYLTLLHTPLLVSNLGCERADDFRCRALARPAYRVIERDGVRVGLFGVVRRDLTARILDRSSGSLRVDDPAATARRLTRLLRTRHKVDLVVMLADVNLEGEAPGPALALVDSLGADAPDLVVASNMFARGSRRFLLGVQQGGGTTIVGTDRFGQHLGHAIVHLAPSDADATHDGRAADPAPTGQVERVERVELRRHRVARFEPAPKAVPRVRALMTSLCRASDRPLGHGRFDTPMRQDGFVDYLMAIMRRSQRAEIAALNLSAVADTTFPLTGRLTSERLLRSIRTSTTVGRVLLEGSQVIALLGPYATDEGELRVLGLTKRGKSWLVNGRPLVQGQRYRVATTAFVAGGGDRLLPEGKLAFRDDGVQLRALASSFFAGDGSALEDGNPNIALATDFPSLAHRWLFFGALDVGVGFGAVAVTDGTGGRPYARPLLSRDTLTSLLAELKLLTGASTVDHRIELDLSLRYGRTWTRAGTGETVIAESQDQLRANLIYRLAKLRNLTAVPHWYVPEPFAELTVVSEFTPSGAYLDAAGVAREYRFVELEGVVGLGFAPHPNLFFKAGLVVRGQLGVPEPATVDLPAEPGIYLGQTLRRLHLWDPVEVESRLDFYLTSLGDERRHELNLSSGLYVKLGGNLKIGITHRIYAFGTRSRDTSMANDLTAGLNLLYDLRRQTF